MFASLGSCCLCVLVALMCYFVGFALGESVLFTLSSVTDHSEETVPCYSRHSLGQFARAWRATPRNNYLQMRSKWPIDS